MQAELFSERHYPKCFCDRNIDVHAIFIVTERIGTLIFSIISIIHQSNNSDKISGIRVLVINIIPGWEYHARKSRADASTYITN